MAGRDLSAELFGDSAKPVVGRDFSAELFGEKPKDEGFLTNVGKLALEGGERAIGAAKVSPSVISGNVGKEQAKGIAEQLAMKPTVQPKELTEVTTAFKDEAEALKKAQGFKESVVPTLQFMGEFGKQALTNPKGVAYLTAQSAANMAPSILGMIAGGKAGAAVGTAVTPGVGTAIGGVGGAIAGGFAGSAPMEIGAEFIDNVGKELGARGLEPTQENVEALLSDKAFVEKAVSEARTKGTTTAAVDAVMTAGAGRYATGPRRAAIKAAQTEMGAAADAAAVAKRAEEILKQGTKVERAGRAVKRGAGAVGIDVAGGGLSEAAGQYAAYGEVDPESVALEMLGELGGSAIEVPSAAYATGRDALKAKAKTDAAKIIEQEKTAQEPAPAAKPVAPAEPGLNIEDLEREAGLSSAPQEPAKIEDLIAQEPAAEPAAQAEPETTVAAPEITPPEAQAPAAEAAAPVTEPAAAPAEAKVEAPVKQKLQDLIHNQEPATEYDTPDNRLRESDAFGQDLLSLIKDELESYGRAAAKNRKLTEKAMDMRETWAAASDAATIAFATSDYEKFRPYERFFAKTAAKLKSEIGKVTKLAKADEKALAEIDKPVIAAEEMEGVPAPLLPEIEQEVGKLTEDQAAAIAEREKLEKRTAGTSLMQVLKGTLNDNELSELGGRARKVGRNQFLNLKASKGKVGSSMEDMVNSGKLDIFLPENMRPGHPDYENSESAEYIRDKLRNNQFYTYDTEREIERVNQDIESIERRIQELLSDDDINKEIQYAVDEQRELDQAAEEPVPEGEAGAPEQREAKATDDELDRREAQLDREKELNDREAKLLEERKRLEEERLKLEQPTKQDIADQEERKAKAAELDEREQIRKESEAGAGQFELTQEEGRQDTTGGLFEQAPEPETLAIGTEEERKTALQGLWKSLSTNVPNFRARGGDGRVTITKPKGLNGVVTKEVYDLSKEALDLGLPPAVLGNVKAAGSTRTDAVALMTSTGWLLIGKQWNTSSRAEKLLAIVHELGHTVDTEGGKISESKNWEKAHRELGGWYAKAADKFRHPLSYPFATQYRGKVRMEMESFAQAFGHYFISPVDLQKNAPEAYSQIQSIVERIQNESQQARAAGTTKTSTAGIKIQPTRTAKGPEVQPETREVGAVVSPTQRVQDRAARQVSANSGAVMFDQKEIEKNRTPEYKSRTKLIEMSIDDFLALSDDGTADYKTEGVRKLVSEGKKFSSLPFLIIDREGRVEGHEGRHRARALKDAGYTTMPVILRSANIRWSEQSDPDRFDYVEEWPTRMRAQKDASNPNFSIPFPVNREESDLPYGQTADINMLKAAKKQTESPEFKRWFGDSKVVDADGNPRVMYHGTTKDIEAFEKRGGAIFVSPSKAFANKFAMDDMLWTEGDIGQAPTGANVVPVYVRTENPFDFESASDVKKVAQLLDPADRARFRSGASTGRWQDIEDFLDSIEEAGFDGAYILEQGIKNLAVFDPKQLKSAIGNIGTFSPETADINMMQAPQKGRENIIGEVTTGNWTLQPNTKLDTKDSLIYKLLDKNIDLKRVVQAIKGTGREIATRWNPYLQEELYHGRTAKQTQDFMSKEVKPLIEEMDKNGVTIGEFEQYLHNRHAEAYNKHVAKVNPNTPEMQDGGSGITTEDARKYLADLPADKKKLYESLAKRIDEMTKGTRELLVESGLEKRETIEAWEKAFPDYVPLMREEEDFEYTTNSFGVGQGFDVRGSFSKRAMGSKRNVVDILANAVLSRERAIVKAEKNRVAQAVYGLAIQNGNPDFWMAVNPMAEKIPQVALDDLARLNIGNDALEFLMKEPRQRAIDPKKNEVISRINSRLRDSQYVLSMRLNGENRYVFFNPNNERAKRAATALKNLDAQQLGYIMGIMSRITRYMSAINTQYNPIFGAYNFLRDVQGAAFQLSTTPIAGKQKEVGKNVLPAMKAIFQSLRKGEPMDTEMGRLWEDFQKAGGQTGFRDMYSRSQDRAEALLDEFKKMSDGRLKRFGRNSLKLLSDYNDTMENAVRLSAYKVALENGFNKDEAASIAKNLTVNFNRKGDIAVQAGALYAFFNASMQGTARLIETLKGPLGKKIVYGGLLWGVMQSALLAMAGFDEEEPPEFVRERNFIIPIFGTDKYLAFPMPLGYHVIPGFSRSITDAVLNYAGVLKSSKTMAERVKDLTGMFLEAFNPIGNAGWSFQTLAFTPFDPIVALFENKDWTGKKIYKEDFSDQDPTPGYTRARDSATYLGTQIAKFLNLATGGTKYQRGIVSPTPEQLEYLAGQAFGGVGREVGKIMTTTEKLITGEELPPYKIPLAGRFYGETKSSAAESSRFYKNLQHLNKLENEINGRKEHKEPMGTFMADNPEARLIKRAEETYSDVKKLRQRKEKLLERNAPRESIKAVENQITMKMRMLNEQVEKAKK